jgi:hypothetical protein
MTGQNSLAAALVNATSRPLLARTSDTIFIDKALPMVVLPQPDGPIMAAISSACTSV